MTKTVKITSPDNPHAMAAYALPVVVGAGNLWKGEPPKAMAELIGPGWSMMILIAMILAGLLGMVGAWTAARVREPVLSLSIEMGAVGAVGAVLLFYVATLFYAYDPAAVVTTIGMAAVVGVGSIWRMFQVNRDRRKIKRAIRSMED